MANKKSFERREEREAQAVVNVLHAMENGVSKREALKQAGIGEKKFNVSVGRQRAEFLREGGKKQDFFYQEKKSKTGKIISNIKEKTLPIAHLKQWNYLNSELEIDQIKTSGNNSQLMYHYWRDVYDYKFKKREGEPGTTKRAKEDIKFRQEVEKYDDRLVTTSDGTQLPLVGDIEAIDFYFKNLNKREYKEFHSHMSGTP